MKSKVALTILTCLVTSVFEVHAQTYTSAITLNNPSWQINLTDYGYSDYLGDLTPGFVGREYLSGEWGAAVGYTVGGTTVAPVWLEKNFIYPDWTTNSNFNVVSGIAVTGTNAAGLEIAQSIIENGDLKITIDYEMQDTITGMAMGNTAASAGGAGVSVDSNRYVLKQTYTVENISGSDITNVQLFQLLHDLNGQSGVYDDRTYAGSLGGYRYDTTLAGVDPSTIGAAGASSEGFKDYIGFGSSLAPSDVELGYYGINDGVSGDNHSIGKPSVGVHLSIEGNALNGTDSFAPEFQWVAGAQQWTLGTLVAGSSVSLDVVLGIRTGTQVAAGGLDDPGTSGSVGGGTTYVGGCDFEFEGVDEAGEFLFEFSEADEFEIEDRIAEGEFEPIDFTLAGTDAQLWLLEFDGQFTGEIHLTFAYNPDLLPEDFDEGSLVIYHFNGTTWDLLAGTVDQVNNTIQVATPGLSPFVLGVNPVPEPSSVLLLALAGTIFACGHRRSRRTVEGKTTTAGQTGS